MTVDREKVIEKLSHHLVRALQDVLGMDIVISAQDEFGFLLPEGHDVLTCTGPMPLGERDIAKTILQSIEAQDLVIVPVEPTEERLEAIARKRFDFVWKDDAKQPDFDQWFKAFMWEVELYYKAMIQSQKGGSDD